MLFIAFCAHLPPLESLLHISDRHLNQVTDVVGLLS